MYFSCVKHKRFHSVLQKTKCINSQGNKQKTMSGEETKIQRKKNVLKCETVLIFSRKTYFMFHTGEKKQRFSGENHSFYKKTKTKNFGRKQKKFFSEKF